MVYLVTVCKRRLIAVYYEAPNTKSILFEVQNNMPQDAFAFICISPFFKVSIVRIQRYDSLAN